MSGDEEGTQPVQDQAWQAEQFERHRPQLTAVACRGALVALLDPDVVFRSQVGERPWLAPARLTGVEDVARHTLTAGSRFAPLCQPALVNGAPAIVVPAPGGPLAVARLAISGDRITAIELILDPAVLRAFTVVDDGWPA